MAPSAKRAARVVESGLLFIAFTCLSMAIDNWLCLGRENSSGTWCVKGAGQSLAFILTLEALGWRVGSFMAQLVTGESEQRLHGQTSYAQKASDQF